MNFIKKITDAVYSMLRPNENRRILLISSLPPEHSAGLGLDLMKALQGIGCDVTFYSRWKSKLKIDGVRHVKRTFEQRMVAPFISEEKYKLRFKDFLKSTEIINGIRIIYPDESLPDLPCSRVAGNIGGKYDYIVTLFWEGMFNSSTLSALGKKFHCPVLIYSVDMAPLTGGCFYFNSCDGYKRGCGRCPGMASDDPDDNSHKNFELKKKNYRSTDFCYVGNSWMCDRARESGLFDKDRIFHSGLVLNSDYFKPCDDIAELRRESGLDKDSIVFLCRSTTVERKGTPYFIKAFKKFWNQIEESVRKRIVVITMEDETVAKELIPSGVDVRVNQGFVDADTLVRLYQMSTVFVSTSIDDAGPSMINQSLLCGTPVISFATGVALDIVVDSESGWRVGKGDTDGLAESFRLCSAMTPEEIDGLRKSSREMGLANSSYEAVGRSFEKIFNSLG